MDDKAQGLLSYAFTPSLNKVGKGVADKIFDRFKSKDGKINLKAAIDDFDIKKVKTRDNAVDALARVMRLTEENEHERRTQKITDDEYKDNQEKLNVQNEILNKWLDEQLRKNGFSDADIYRIEEEARIKAGVPENAQAKFKQEIIQRDKLAKETMIKLNGEPEFRQIVENAQRAYKTGDSAEIDKIKEEIASYARKADDRRSIADALQKMHTDPTHPLSNDGVFKLFEKAVESVVK
jgi:hypothetical protein